MQQSTAGLTESFIRTPAEKIIVLQNLAANPQARNQVIGFVKANTGAIISKLKAGAIKSFIGALSNYVGTSTQLDDVSLTQ